MTSIKLTKDEVHFLIPTSQNGFFTFSNLIYVNTIKEPLKRAYSRNEISKFQNLISEHISKDITRDYIRDKDINKYQINTSETINENPSFYTDNSEIYEHFIQKWLKEFEIGEELTYGYDDENDIYFIKIDNKSLPEYGLGYGLIIHILLALSNEIKEKRFFNWLVESKYNLNLSFPATYIIEEPETGLHPAFQSKMAEMIVDIQKTFEVNLIIETHSEYFIRKLQFLTATNEINPDDVIIYYFNNPKKVPENEEQIKKITIDKNGSLSDTFGTGFMDEGTNIKFELLRSINRQQN